MKLTKLILSTIILLSSTYLSAQESNDVSSYAPRDWTIVPPAPEVASMMKFVTIPVSPFTGQPNIDLPIYTLREGSIEIPISIRYHGGGIKVNENAGILGLGWSLNAGGCISRTVYGFPDETTGTQTSAIGLFNLDNNSRNVRNVMINRVDGLNPIEPNNCFSLGQCENIDLGIRDVSNDIFQISCLGHTGTFIYQPDGSRKMILSTGSPIKFTGSCTNASSSNIGPFEFSDISGNKYEFNSNHVDETKLFYRRPTNETEFDDSLYYKSAWHISKITNLSGDTVTFNYIPDKYRYHILGSNYYQSISSNDSITRGGESVSSSSVHYNAKTISEIITSSTIAVFTYHDDKETLKSISIHRNNANRDLIKKFVFNQSNFTIWNKTRKQLKEVIEYGSNNSDAIKLYEFTYSSGFSGNNNANLAQDEWGFFNGEINTTLVYGPKGANIELLSFANRTPSESYTKAGILTSIKYPTGGSTTFDWELNDYSYISQYQIPQKNITIKDTTYTTLNGKSNEHIYKVDQVNDKSYKIIVQNKPIYTEIDITKYIEPIKDGLNWDGYYETHFPDNSNIPTAGYIPRIEIRNYLGQLIKRWYIDNMTSHEDNNSLYVTLETPGEYTITLCNPTNFEGVTPNNINNFFGDGPDNNYTFGFITIKMIRSRIATSVPKKPWGGLRIASITSNSNENPSISKSYEYKQDLGSDFSSGTIQDTTYYFSKSHLQKLVEAAPPYSGQVPRIADIIGYHSNGLFSTPCGGSQIEYPYVWELYPDNNTSIRYYYSSQRSIFDEVDAVYYEWIPGGSRMKTSYAHLRGDLISKKYYFNNDLYKAENYENRYNEFLTNDIFTGNLNRIFSIKDNSLYGDDGTWLSSNYALCRYKLVQYNKNPRSIETVEYDNNGASIVDSVYYTYFNEDYYEENPKYNLPKTKSIINSKGEIETTYFTYLSGANGDAINFPETEVTICGGKIINAKKMVYDDKYRMIAIYSSPSGLDVENSFSLGGGFHATNALKNAINIPSYSYRYNDDGNIIEISYNGIVLASYIWGYQGSHPIAEIKNVSYNDVCNALPSSLHPDVLSNSNNITEANLNSIRSYFPGKDIITMNYHWLIGVATTIDSRGIPTRYNYDSFGRLDGVKDYNNYFIKKYSYNFIND